MSQSFRLSQILDRARKEGRVTVDALAVEFDVAAQTIRRDLTDLAEAGKLERVHGGAVLPSGVANIGYEDRRSLNAAAKQAIARCCGALIPNGASVFLNIGTTTEAVARALLHHEDLLVVTNNMNVATILAANPEAEIIVAGGTLRRSDGGLIGHQTIRTIEQFKFDVAVIGCSALDPDGDVLDFDVEEVSVSQSIIARSRQSILVSDQSKFQRTAPARITSLQQIDHFVTDAALPGDLATKCGSWDTAIHLAD